MPYFSSTIFVVVIVGAVLTTLTGYFLFARALFPRFVDRAERAWTERSVTSVVLGAPVASLLGAVSVGLLVAPLPPLRIAGFLFSGIALGFALAGSAGLAARIGRGLASRSDEGREWAQLLRGGIVLEVTMLFPILGWFVVAPIAVVGGAGAAMLALFGRKAAAKISVPLAAPVLERAP